MVRFRQEKRVLDKDLAWLKSQLDLAYIDSEEKGRVNVLHVLSLFIGYFGFSQIPESEVSIHHSVKFVDFDAILENERFLSRVQKKRESSYYAPAGAPSPLLLSSEPPISSLLWFVIK